MRCINEHNTSVVVYEQLRMLSQLSRKENGGE